MTIRKNFNFDEETARHLEELAKIKGKTQTEVVKEAVEKVYKEVDTKRKLAILDEIAGSLSGKIGDIDIKEARRTYLEEKYGY